MSDNFRNVLQDLVNKLESIQKDEYTKHLYGNVCKLWRNELAEAKKILDEDWGRGLPSVRVAKKEHKSHGIPEDLCVGYSTKQIDLFDTKQLELDERAKKIIKATHGETLLDDSLKDENEL